jgi:hypothetical protein
LAGFGGPASNGVPSSWPLVGFISAGLLGVFGSRTETVSAEAAGYELTVVYPRVTRPGLPVRWQYTLMREGGFDGPIRIATTFDYLHLLDTTNIEPDPASQSSTRDDIVWEFDPPPGDTLRVSFDAQAEVGLHESRPVSATVFIDGRAVVRAWFSTLVIP